MTFSRSWLDTDGRNIVYKSFATFQDNLIIWDTGIAVNNGRAIETADGVTWSVLFSVLGATYGNFNVNDGGGMVVYDSNLFVSLRRTGSVNPKVIEYDPIAGTVTSHLPDPQGGGADNVMALEQIVWANKLWVTTDNTAAVSDRRVVYYYDGSSWTAIVNYGGVGTTYLTFNKGDGSSPIVRLKHRTTRFFIFNNDLYLIATRWSTGEATWAWEVWKFDAEDFDNFDLVFDSEDFADGFTLSAILEHEGTVYVVGNEITPTGNPFDPAKLYSSTDMENWTEETGAAIFEDEFDDAARDPEWTDEVNLGTIVEAGNTVTYAVIATVNGNFWGAVKNAPISTIEPDDDEVVVTTKLDSYTINDCTRAGIYITDLVGGNNGIHFGRVKGGGQDGLGVINMGVGGLAYVAVTSDPIWLRVRIKGSGTGSVMKFDYSTDGATWYWLWTQNNETWDKVGLTAWNWDCGGATYNAVSVPFEFFHVLEGDMSMTGYVFGEASFNGKMYFNCIDPTNGYTWIKYWDENAGEFLLDQEITTNPLATRGGGLVVFNTNALFVGKWKEVWAEFWATTERQLRRKGRSIPLLEMTFIDKLGNELKEYYTFIDAAAPTRFWQGRIKSMSSLTRAIDDRTGLYKIADMEMTFANHDRKFSKLVTTYILKNQEAKLYHVWVDEPEVSREHIITFFVDDFSIEGTHFNVRFKDATHRYFTKKIPENICTVDDFLRIHPDAVGKYMPEVLGESALGLTYEHPGSIEAIYINTVSFTYLAAARTLHSITQVFSADVLMATPGDYSVVYAGGRTYIDFVLTQGDKKITYNGTGYPFGAWNSINGYVQNPAYIAAYYLQFIMGMSGGLIDFNAVNRMATYFENIGEETSGKLIIQRGADAMEILRENLFSHGMKGYVAKGGGKFTIDRKDIHNYEIENVDDWLLTQTDLFGSPVREWNLPNAINTINARFNYIPWQNIYIGADSEFRDNFIDERMEDDIRIRRPPLEI